MTYDSTADTLDHIGKVQSRIAEMVRNLDDRSAKHDASKLQEPEKSGYDRMTARLKDLRYGSDEYRQALADNAPAIQHHYAVNDHHPEHYGERGISGMTWPALAEMLCDWKAASERMKQGSIMQSLEYNRVRFGIDDQLYAIICNTVRELGW